MMKSLFFHRLLGDEMLRSETSLNVKEAIHICHASLDLNKLNKSIQVNSGDSGAAVVFTGSVRGGSKAFSDEEKGLTGMTLEHYPGMTESLLAEILRKAQLRWGLSKIIVAHRVGFLMLGEPVVFIGVAGQHRKEAFLAAEFIMDYLKQSATFWKKEHYGENSIWVEAKQSDKDAVVRWQGE